MANQVVQVRDGATITTLLLPPFPITQERPVRGRMLSGQVVYSRAGVVTFHYDATPAPLFSQLYALPVDHEIDVWCPLPWNGVGSTVRWGWVRGTWQRPATWANRNRSDFGPTDWRLLGAREV